MNTIKYIIFTSLPLLLFADIQYEQPWGKDSDLCEDVNMEVIDQTINKKKLNICTKVADKIITFKQKVISPVDGPRSHFRPTSSRYMQLAMYRYGFFKGFIMGCDRLLRENSEEWVYRTIIIDDTKYKYDPAVQNKYSK